MSRSLSNGIRPGRRMISEEAALFAAGYREEEASYRAEQTIVSANSTINDTIDMQERAWRKQGISDEEIFRRLEARAVEKHTEHRQALRAAMDGAKNFEELLNRPQYAVRRHAEENEENQHSSGVQFAIPALPKHLGATPKAKGQPGFGCSTPIGSDVSMRSLRNIDISHVIHIEQLDPNAPTTHTKNVVIEVESANSTLPKTHTIRKDGESLQGTFTVAQPAASTSESSLQKTFVKESQEPLQGTFTVPPAAPSESTLQTTHTIQKDADETAIQGTFVVEKEKDKDDEQAAGDSEQSLQATFVVEEPPRNHETSQGGNGARRARKVDLKEREGRMADLTSSMMGSLMDTPSPGAHHFKNPRKKLRETAAPRLAATRLSTESSDQERSIQMLSINEDSTRGRESIGSSYVDPVSVNASQQMETVVEEEEAAIATRNTPRPLSPLTAAGESVRAAPRSSIIATTTTADTTGLLTPTRNFQRPTISSLSKSRNANAKEILETMSQKKSTAERKEAVEEEKEKEQVVPEVVVNSFRQISFHDPSPSPPPRSSPPRSPSPVAALEDVDFGDDAADQSDPEEGTSGPPPAFLMLHSHSHRGEAKCQRKPRIGLLSDSMTSINTPGIDKRRGRVNETVPDEWNSDEEEQEQEEMPRRRKPKQIGLQLAKRRIIEPEQAPDGVRRSTRTRVKPVRNWLGEKPIYVHSPSGGRRLKGVTDVFVTDKRMCKYRTADVRLCTEREVASRRKKAKRRAEEKRRQLEMDQSRGRRMDESQDDIHTSDEE